jgi:alpha-beta hydrolase superfamily lysophospholipase
MRGAAMGVLRRRLEPSGFSFHDFTYSSLTGSLYDSVEALAEFVARVPGETVHFVGHSLGGVLICALLERSLPARTGRVVCLGSPLKGSKTAARLCRWPGGRLLIGRVPSTSMRAAGRPWRAGVESAASPVECHSESAARSACS